MRPIFFIAPALFALATTACQSNNQNYQNAPNNPPEVVQQTYIHKYGVAVPPTDWDERGQDGQIITQMSNGVTECKNYEDGMLHGDTTYTFPHSDSTERVATYVQGNLVKETTHYRSGPPMQEVQHHEDNNKTVKAFYEQGTPKSVEVLDNDGNLVKADYYNLNQQVDAQVENRQGVRIVRNQYGLIGSKDTIQDGIMVAQTTFHYNGTPKEVVPYKDGIVEGTLKTYLPDGEPNSIEQWSGGFKNGTSIVFVNGEKSAEIPYVQGKKQGIEKRYRDGDTVVEEISWVNNLQDGPRTLYVAGTPTQEWYFEGQPVSKANYELRMHAANRPTKQLFPQATDK